MMVIIIILETTCILILPVIHGIYLTAKDEVSCSMYLITLFSRKRWRLGGNRFKLVGLTLETGALVTLVTVWQCVRYVHFEFSHIHMNRSLKSDNSCQL